MDTTSLQPGDVILFAGTSFVSRGIKYFTKSKWSHAAIYVGGGEGFIVEATAAGVEKNKLEATLKHCSAWCVRRYPNLTVAQAEAMKTEAYGFLPYKYDFVQLLTLGVFFSLRKIGITWNSIVDSMPGRMICSELVAVCYQVIDVMFNKRTKMVTPDMLYTTGLLTTIQESEYK
jgi:hypothetical protein